MFGKPAALSYTNIIDLRENSNRFGLFVEKSKSPIFNNVEIFIIMYRGFPLLNKEAKPVGIFAQIDYICVR